MKIPLSCPDISEREIEAVSRVLRSGQLSLGPRLEEFEDKLAAFVGTRYAVACNSGTSALHLAVKALGIGPEDEVITSSFSFVASANCLLFERAVPVFADIDPVTLNIDPAAVRAILDRDYSWDANYAHLVNRHSGRKLRAILPVHVFGLPCDMNALCSLAHEFNLLILEDSCEAFGAEFDGRSAGAFGEAAVFAFYPNKQITTAEGGAVVTNDWQIARLCRSLRNQGRDDQSSWLRHVDLGYNYRLSELHCALGIVQLERAKELLEARTCVAAEYSRQLAGIPGIVLPAGAPSTRRSWFVYVIRVESGSPRSLRDMLMAGLRGRGIACASYFPPIHQQPYFRQYCSAQRYSLPHTEAAGQQCLALPFFSTMTREQIAEVSAAVREILSSASSSRGEGSASLASASAIS